MTADEFQETRRALGLTQLEWGRWLGVTRSYVARLEANRVPITVTIARLAQAYRDGYRPDLGEPPARLISDLA